MVLAAVGCCGPGGQFLPPTYKNYGPCDSCGTKCGGTCAMPCIGCGSSTCDGDSCDGDSCDGSCEESCTSCREPSCGTEAATCGCGTEVSVASSDCSTCGQSPCGCGPRHWPNPFAHLTDCLGCGELYWSEWHNNPPDLCDPCDCHGYWTGHAAVQVGYHGPPRAGSAYARPVVVDESVAADEVMIEEIE